MERIGFSSKINDPAFSKYQKNSNRWAGIFALILAITAVMSFYTYGEVSPAMDNQSRGIIYWPVYWGDVSVDLLISDYGQKKKENLGWTCDR